MEGAGEEKDRRKNGLDFHSLEHSHTHSPHGKHEIPGAGQYSLKHCGLRQTPCGLQPEYKARQLYKYVTASTKHNTGGQRKFPRNRYNNVRSLIVAFIAMAALIAGCESDEAPRHSGSIGSAGERIRLAQESLMRARVAIEEFPKLDLTIRATRQFVIMRQVELSEEPMERKTQEDLAGAKARAAEILPVIAQFSPMLLRIEEALLDLRGALYRTMREEGISSESRAALGLCRTMLGELLDDLGLAYQVLNTSDSVSPKDSEYYDPDFRGVLQLVGTVLNQARN